MRDLVGIIGGIGILIGIYLFIKNGDNTVKVINSIASNATKGISTLQGR